MYINLLSQLKTGSEKGKLNWHYTQYLLTKHCTFGYLNSKDKLKKKKTWGPNFHKIRIYSYTSLDWWNIYLDKFFSFSVRITSFFRTCISKNSFLLLLQITATWLRGDKGIITYLIIMCHKEVSMCLSLHNSLCSGF